jgi:hypothetical protein
LHRCSRVVNNLPAVAVPIRVDKYFASGAQQVWLLFPETRTVNVYTSPFTCAHYSPTTNSQAATCCPTFDAL